MIMPWVDLQTLLVETIPPFIFDYEEVGPILISG